jgi:histidinol-phosphate/aromatic aminotransferase/cobyric acid decarboxylase-like protein
MLARGVILRHLAPFGWPSLVRVTIGLAEENGYLMEMLTKVWREING